MRKRRTRRDPFADYVEWSDNRYNPGHYLGGNLPPYLRKSSLGPRASRRMGIALTISACIGAGTLLVTLPWPESGISVMFSAAGVLLTGCAAVAMFRSSQRKRQRLSSRQPPSN
jgi:hypothetical protein